MVMVRRIFAGLVILFCCFSLQAQPIDAGASKVSATFRQLGVPVQGVFKNIKGDVEFDPKRAGQAKASLEIDVSGFDLGDKEYNAEVAKKDWFDAKNHPKASFVLSSVTPVNATQYKAAGSLSIKGKTANLQFPVDIKMDAGKSVFEGKVAVNRLFFNIGEGEWKDTALVADEVVIQFRVVGMTPSSGAKK